MDLLLPFFSFQAIWLVEIYFEITYIELYSDKYYIGNVMNDYNFVSLETFVKSFSLFQNDAVSIDSS